MKHKIIKINSYGYDDTVIHGYHDDNGNFLLHNDAGPAVIDKDGSKEWWMFRFEITREVEEWLEERNLDPDNLSEEDQLALSFYMRSLT